MKAKDLRGTMKRGAGCLIICTATSRFLLIRRSQFVPEAGTWSLPGGKVESGERAKQGAIRETMEEIGRDLTGHRMDLVYVNDTHAPRFRFYTYATTVDKQFEPMLNWENDGYLWCDLDDLPSPLHWGLQQMLAHDGAGKRVNQLMVKKSSVLDS